MGRVRREGPVGPRGTGPVGLILGGILGGALTGGFGGRGGGWGGVLRRLRGGFGGGGGFSGGAGSAGVAALNFARSTAQTDGIFTHHSVRT
jgi:hypothetical protein